MYQPCGLRGVDEESEFKLVIAMYLKHREEGSAELDQLVLKDHLKD